MTITCKSKNKFHTFWMYARELPKEIWRRYHPDSFIEVSTKESLTANWLTPEEEQEILQISEDAKKGINVSWPMTPDEFLNELKNIRNGNNKN